VSKKKTKKKNMLSKLKTNYLDKVIRPSKSSQKKVNPKFVSRNSNFISVENKTINTEMNLLSI